LRLVEGQPSPATDSVHGAIEDDRLLFSGLLCNSEKKGIESGRLTIRTLAEYEKRLVYHLLKSCDEVYRFRLAQLATDDKEARTMTEGEWMALRRNFGLVNVGDWVHGGNGKWPVELYVL
jgi:hypothetical protein